MPTNAAVNGRAPSDDNAFFVRLLPAPDEKPTVPGTDCLWLLTFAPDQVRKAPLRGLLIRSRQLIVLQTFYRPSPILKGGQTELRSPHVRRRVPASGVFG